MKTRHLQSATSNADCIVPLPEGVLVSHTSPRQHEILVVDDIAANLKLLSNILADEHYNVRVASMVRWHSLDSCPKPDLVLLDIKMPDMDGFEVCKRLKAEPETASIPIIFISALNETEGKVDAFRAGGVDYITKPFANEEVLARVHTHLELNDYKTIWKKKSVKPSPKFKTSTTSWKRPKKKSSI